MIISLDKEIVSGVIRQTIDVEFRGEKHSSVYPIFVQNRQIAIDLHPIVSANDPGPDLVEAIYEALIHHLEGVLDPKNIPGKTEQNKDVVSPTIKYAKAVSKHVIEVKFDGNVRASNECLSGVEFQSSNPHICCQIIFRQKPLLKGN